MDFDLFTISIKGFINKTYEVYLEGELQYIAKPKGLFSLTYHLYDNQGEIVTTIKKKMFSFEHAHDIKDSFGLIGTVVKRAFSNSYEFPSTIGFYTVEGNFWSTNFDLYRDKEEFAKISRKKMQRKNAFGIAVKHEEDHSVTISMIIALILIRQARKRSK